MSVTTIDPDKPLAWFRFDAAFADSPRIRQLPDQVQLAYVLALCAAARRIAPCSDEDFAWWSRWTLEVVASCKRQLVAAELVTDEWLPSDWDRHQPTADATNAERQRRWRERRKRQSATVTDRNALPNALVTPAQDRTGQDRTDITNRTGQDIGAASSASTSHNQSIPESKLREALQDPFPKNGRARARSGDFDDVLTRVRKAVVDGRIPASDIQTLGRVTGCTQKQVRVAVDQLRDRRQL